MQRNQSLCVVSSLLLVVACAGWWCAAGGAAEPWRAATVSPTVPAPEMVTAPLERHVALVAGYVAPVGTRLHYELSSTTCVTLTGGAAGASQAPMDVATHGTLQVVVLGRRSDAMLVGMDCDDASITSPGAVAPAAAAQLAALQQALQRGFDLRLDPAGRPLAIRWHGAWTAAERNFARALTSTLRLEFLPAAQWDSTCSDAMGTHGFHYCATVASDGVRLLRTRTTFSPCGGDDDAGEHAAVRHEGRASARFAAAVGWLTDVQIDDAVAWSWIGGGLRVAATQRASLRWLRSDQVAVDADWELGFVALDDDSDAAAAALDPMRELWAQRLAGRDVQTLLAELANLLARGQQPDQEHLELLQLLAEIVRRDPTEATRLGQQVQSAGLTGQLAADVLAVLGIAGHEPAQAALVGVFENGLVEAGLRQAAAESMFQIEQPGRALVDGLQRSLHGARLDALAGSALLVLGAFAGRGATTADGRPVVSELLALAGSARDGGIESAYFEALGNSGDPAVMPLATQLLGAADPIDRAFGLTAMRRVHSPQADALLQAVARGDATAEVRRQALEQVGASQAAWSLDLLIERSAADADVEVRRTGLSGLLLRARSEPRARAALQQRLLAEPDAGLRQQLQQLLAGA